MSTAIPIGFITQYEAGVSILLQQSQSLLRHAVMEKACIGDQAVMMEQFGKLEAQKAGGRHSATPHMDTPEDRRWVYPQDYDVSDMVDNTDILRLRLDPKGPYVQITTMALARRIDDEILKGFFGPNQTGKTGTVQINFSTDMVIPVDQPGQDGKKNATGLTVDKIKAARKKLMKNQVNIQNESLYMVISSDDWEFLLNDIRVTSRDYVASETLQSGNIPRYMGFEFIISERIPGGIDAFIDLPAITKTGVSRQIPFWTKTGVGLGMWNDIKVRVGERMDRRYSWEVYTTGTFGATRLEEKRCGYIEVA